MHASGDFVIAWKQRISGFHSEIHAQRICRSGTPLGSFVPLSGEEGSVKAPSIAASRGGHYHVTWVGVGPNFGIGFYHLLAVQSDFDDFASIDRIPNPEPDEETGGDETPSAGASDAEDNQATVGWTNFSANKGLHTGIDGIQADTLRECDDYCSARITQWLPCVSTRSEDGIFAIAFAYDEAPDEEDSSLNIALMVFDAEGNLLEQLAGPDVHDPDQWVNDPSKEDPSLEDPTSQLSPSVAFVGDDIVVAWAGPDIDTCQGTDVDHVYARRFKFDISGQPGERLRDPDPLQGEGRAGMFVVDSDPDARIFNPLVARPAVALTLATGADAGRFVVAWNSENTADNRKEIHAQYFDNTGQSRGLELRVNQSTAATANTNERFLMFSGQHTIAYGANDQLVAVWTSLVYNQFFQAENSLSYTLLPAEYAQTSFPDCDICQTNPEICDPCRKGDVTGDCKVDGLDIQEFVDLLLAGPDPCIDVVTLCPRDTNNDGAHTVDDIPCFVATLLAGVNNCEVTPSLRGLDCNENGTADLDDIIAETSEDLNDNGVPDECEPDCNTNGTLDEIDVLTETSADCNGNLVPDECENDCNTNGVPDDCDVDPSDPDGDEWVSPDCNGNEYPDECDLALPPGFGSLDCNDNDIPDECDIAECESDPACADCNENGIPDGCDITAEISEDADTNGIPDECEEESLLGGGGGESMMGGGEGLEEGGDTTGETQMSPGDEEAAWEAFFEWSMAQCWGGDCETTGAEQFAAMVAKMRELGLTVGDCAP
ncbi:MAG: hypothetical protein DCC65_16340 [Planctomycetota bacterium]|nr:MAG: hypothetical protein DCC65_16340 [Planctomycetota bacterium]